jgi:hypothetical protein
MKAWLWKINKKGLERNGHDLFQGTFSAIQAQAATKENRGIFDQRSRVSSEIWTKPLTKTNEVAYWYGGKIVRKTGRKRRSSPQPQKKKRQVKSMCERNDKFSPEQLCQSAKHLCQYTARNGSSIYVNCIALKSSSPSHIRVIHLGLFPDVKGDVSPHASQQLSWARSCVCFSYTPNRAGWFSAECSWLNFSGGFHISHSVFHLSGQFAFLS